MRGDVDDRRVADLAVGGEHLGQLDAGHAAELDVEHHAVELRPLACRPGSASAES